MTFWLKSDFQTQLLSTDLKISEMIQKNQITSRWLLSSVTVSDSLSVTWSSPVLTDDRWTYQWSQIPVAKGRIELNSDYDNHLSLTRNGRQPRIILIQNVVIATTMVNFSTQEIKILKCNEAFGRLRKLVTSSEQLTTCLCQVSTNDRSLPGGGHGTCGFWPSWARLRVLCSTKTCLGITLGCCSLLGQLLLQTLPVGIHILHQPCSEDACRLVAPLPSPLWWRLVLPMQLSLCPWH